MRVGVVRVWEDADYLRVKKLCESDSGWIEVYKKGSKRIFIQSVGTTSVQMIKAHVAWNDITADVLFDTLHDSDYRSKWDKYMITSKDIGFINPNNDICYYSIKAVSPIRPRDFVLQRSWLDTGNEKLLCSHSVCHEDFPPINGNIRGTTFVSGYYIRSAPKGCILTFVSHTDPGGKVPTWLVNRVSKTMAPKAMDKLYKAALQYPEWKRKTSPNWKPWLNPDQIMDLPRIDMKKCEPREYEPLEVDESQTEEEQKAEDSD